MALVVKTRWWDVNATAAEHVGSGLTETVEEISVDEPNGSSIPPRPSGRGIGWKGGSY